MTVTSPIPVPATFSGPSLSPSRAADFKTCPLLFRFRTIDKLPERPSADQVRGTLVHAVLESLFDLPAAERTPAAAAALVAPSWERLLAQEPSLSQLFAPAPNPAPAPATAGPELPAPGSFTAGASLDGAPAAGAPDAGAPAAGAPDGGLAGAAAGDVVAKALPGTELLAATEPAQLADFLAGAADLLHGYFAVEDPRRFEPAERESLINTLVDDELLIRGYIDRLDISQGGDLRVVDYKTGGAPREAFEGRALFQLKFYALVLWRTRGVVPRVLRLLYLKDAEICDYSPDAEELERFERTLVALSHAIERAKRDRDFRPKPSRLCGWCSHQAFCPEFGGTPPPFPEPAGTEPAGTEASAPEAAAVPGDDTVAVVVRRVDPTDDAM
jgi:putative RecB family exonuclease